MLSRWIARVQSCWTLALSTKGGRTVGPCDTLPRTRDTIGEIGVSGRTTLNDIWNHISIIVCSRHLLIADLIFWFSIRKSLESPWQVTLMYKWVWRGSGRVFPWGTTLGPLDALDGNLVILIRDWVAIFKHSKSTPYLGGTYWHDFRFFHHIGIF